MVQIGRRVLSNYFKTGIRNRFYATNTCFLKNGVSRTPMWTRDFLALYHNIQIINRRLQRTRCRHHVSSDHNIQIINRRLQHHLAQFLRVVIITYKSLTGDYSFLSLTIYERGIITYKSLTGDYSSSALGRSEKRIITYKSLTGDYSNHGRTAPMEVIITYKSLTGDYSFKFQIFIFRHDHNIQIINRRLQPSMDEECCIGYHNIQIINRRLQLILCRKAADEYHNIQIINRRLQLGKFSPFSPALS